MSHIIQHYNNEADIWRDAWRIADPGASNPVAVARTLFAASSFLLHKTGTDSVRKHPALRVIAGQLSFLYGVDRLGPSTEDLDKVRSVFDSLNAGHDLDVAITDADVDMEATSARPNVNHLEARTRRSRSIHLPQASQ